MAGSVNTTGSNNILIGSNANVLTGSLDNAVAIGYLASVNASNKIVLGNASSTTVGGYGLWTNYSDRRLKENISYTKRLGLPFIMKLQTVSYNYINDKNKVRRDGLIAQDVQKALKDLNLEFSGLVVDDDEMETMNISYETLVIPLINAVQEQQQTIAQQQKSIDLLLKQNVEMMKRIESLETK
jgi:hypothetical protein